MLHIMSHKAFNKFLRDFFYQLSLIFLSVKMYVAVERQNPLLKK